MSWFWCSFCWGPRAFLFWMGYWEQGVQQDEFCSTRHRILRFGWYCHFGRTCAFRDRQGHRNRGKLAPGLIGTMPFHCFRWFSSSFRISHFTLSIYQIQFILTDDVRFADCLSPISFQNTRALTKAPEMWNPNGAKPH